MESKRRSLAIKDTDLLEQMLRGDLEGFNQQHHHSHQAQDVYQPSEDEEDARQDMLDLEDEEDEEDSQSTTSSSIAAADTKRNSTIMLIEEQDELNKKGINNDKTISCLTCDGFPCTFPCSHSLKNNDSKTNDPFALFTGVAIALGIASQLGITDDWTVPITLATLVSSFLWNGSKNKPKAHKTL
ncbi:hypothetical protein G6F42_027661 [Rhizopus arrhizus]|nr:hypothetical protein G6F42_027661 [Rhizopus arrhizus]